MVGQEILGANHRPKFSQSLDVPNVEQLIAEVHHLLGITGASNA